MLTEMLKMHDGLPIKVARFEPGESPVGVVLLLHGFGEHIGLYAEHAERFAAHSFVCVVHDQRGHGEMPGLNESEWKRKLGIARSYEDFLNDIDTIRSQIDTWYPGLPVFLYGHSMGGNIALSYLLKRSQERFSKVILETPWLRLYEKNPKALVWLARVLGNISYKPVYPTELNLEAISRDKDYVVKLKSDKLYHNFLSFRLITQIMNAGEYALSNAEKLELPVLLLCAGKDMIVCPQAIRELDKNSNNNVRLVEYPEGYHALHSDIIKENVFEEELIFITSG